MYAFTYFRLGKGDIYIYIYISSTEEMTRELVTPAGSEEKHVA